MIINIILLSWAVFIIFWLFTFGWSKKTMQRRPASERWLYWILLVIGFIFLWNAGSAAALYPLSITLIPHFQWVEILADILAIMGAALALWARISLGSNWSGSVQVKEDHELVTKGPYRFIRHPIYTAMLTLFLASALAIGALGGFIGFIFLIVSCWIKLKQEEDFMLEQFPNDYPTYMHRVKRLIPFII